MTNPPDREETRRLTLAVSQNNSFRVAKLLEDGSNPNGYCTTRSTFPLNEAVRIWKSEDRGEADRREAETIIHMLLDAGASPLAVDGSLSPIIGDMARVCAHPRCLELALEGARNWAWAIKEKELIPFYSKDSAATLLQGLRKEAPEHLSILNHLLDLGLRGATWWQAATVCRSPSLMEFVLENKDRISEGAPPVDWIVQFLTDHPIGTSLKPRGAGVLAWLKHFSPDPQTQALLGTPEREGILAASLASSSVVRGSIWDFALKQNHVVEAIKEQGLLKGFLALSMLGEPRHAQALLKMAIKEGIDVSAVSIQDARQVKKRIPEWDEPYDPYVKVFKPSPHATLISGHMGRRPLNASVTLVRALIKAGVKPDHEALCGLCTQMTYLAKERKYLPLFDDWTTTHQVNPAPEGAIPAWDYITLERPETASRELFRNFLEARHIERVMQEAIPEPAEPTSGPQNRPRGTRL